jgi:hypothetical protein
MAAVHVRRSGSKPILHASAWCPAFGSRQIRAHEV